MSSPREIINTHGYYCATIHGYSMYPLLINHKDSAYIVKSDEYKKYDVALFERADGQRGGEVVEMPLGGHTGRFT